MTTKTIKIPIFENVKTGEKDKTLFVASDGKEFENEPECAVHESALSKISAGNHLVTDVSLGEKQDILSQLIFGGYDVSDTKMFLFTATNNTKELDVINDYLRAKGCKELAVNKLQQKSINELYINGELVLISSWIEYADSDYPRHKTQTILLNDAIKLMSTELNTLSNLCKQ